MVGFDEIAAKPDVIGNWRITLFVVLSGDDHLSDHHKSPIGTMFAYKMGFTDCEREALYKMLDVFGVIVFKR